MKIKYCIFDIGNVCYPYSPKPLNDYIRQLVPDKAAFDKTKGIFSFDFDPLLKGDVTFTECCQSLCDCYHIPFSKEVEKGIYQAEHDCIGTFYPETRHLMSELRAQGFKICLLSNITPDLEDIVPTEIEKDKRFLSYELGLIKPDPEIYKVVLQKLKAQPQETLFIDDLPPNIKAAKALGMNGIVFDKDHIIHEVHNFLFSNKVE